ncbi:MAG TPA: glycosyl transferase family 1, partial [Bacteroidales bacterium]|nr:glycosyl transferase family 1 [Bacteroidales bacterium]
ILKDKEEGILVQDGDPYAMVGAIYELINDIEKAIFYGKNARITALKRHNKKDIVNAIYTIYKSISIK